MKNENGILSRRQCLGMSAGVLALPLAMPGRFVNGQVEQAWLRGEAFGTDVVLGFVGVAGLSCADPFTTELGTALYVNRDQGCSPLGSVSRDDSLGARGVAGIVVGADVVLRQPDILADIPDGWVWYLVDEGYH